MRYTPIVAFLGIVFAARLFGQPYSLDSLVEDADRWQVGQSDRASVHADDATTHDTPRALRLTWRKDLGDIGGTGIPTTPQVPSIWLELPASIDLSRFTRLTYWARISGVRHGHLHVVVSDQPRIWGNEVKNHHNNTPLDAGEWRQYQLTLGQIDPAERTTYRWLGIASINVGHQPDEEPELEVWLDDWSLSDEPIRKTRGWSADPEVVVCSQMGFRRFHEKRAVVDGGVRDTEFAVVALPSEREALRGELEPLASSVGSYKVADFTALTRPGRYQVQVGELRSAPFAIGDDALDPCIALLSDWIFNMRCGCETTLHAACHLDDGTLVDYEGERDERKEIGRRHLDVVGGWHDAGDVRTYYSYTFQMPYQALKARECGWLRDRDGDGHDDLLDAALWGARHLPKIRHPETGAWFPKIEDWPDYRRGNYWTDCVAGTPDDRHIMVRPEDVDSVGQAVASAALFAREASEEYPEVADAALAVARDRWAAWFDPEAGQKRWRSEPIHVHGHGYHIAKWGRGSLQLYLATGEPLYLEFARVCADTIMGYQRRTFYPGAPEPMCGEIFSWLRTLPDRDLPEEYLADLMLELPDDADYYRWRLTLERAARWWMKPTRTHWAPFAVPHLEVPASEFGEDFFGVPLEVGEDGETVRYLVPTTGALQLPDTACALMRVAQVLNDIELERLARAQVQWAVGQNPFGVSWICDSGEDCIDQFYSFSQGRMPGCVSGYGIGDSGVPQCVRPYGGESWTVSGVYLMRAMIAASRPARLHLSFRQGTAPWRGRVLIRWTPTGGTVFRGATDRRGELPEVALDGGQRYEIVLGDTVIPIEVISGTTYERGLDLERLLLLSVEAPAEVKSGETFGVDVAVTNLGRRPTSTTVGAHVDDAIAEISEQRVEVGAGATEAIECKLRAGESGRPYLALFELDRDHDTCAVATGVIQ